jgi:NAD(P)-dependent dehydrogenase (short-subunit alcohol dehydrogenase family)
MKEGRNMGRVENKVAIVTGGAMGMGKASCVLLAKEGAKVVIADINESEGKKVAGEIKANGGTAAFMFLDVGNEENWKKVVNDTVKLYGKLDILVNNAGITLPGNVEETTLENWRKLMNVNLEGVFLGIKYSIKAMKESNNGYGSIINFASVDSHQSQPTLAAYDASKGAVRSLTKSAAVYLGKAGTYIRVNSIHPGFIWTPLQQAYQEALGRNAKEAEEYMSKLQPLKLQGMPEDIAYGVLYLASDESRFVTGSEMVIDGGILSALFPDSFWEFG